ncbi:MAG: SDR family oxidoreductase [Chloroflexota bacterium]
MKAIPNSELSKYDPASSRGRLDRENDGRNVQSERRTQPQSHTVTQRSGARHGTILVTGATGYVGGRLVPALLAAGYRVRCLVRDAARLQGRPWAPDVEIAVGDVLDPSSLTAALRDVTMAYYLVHAMQDSTSFASRDAAAARSFGAAAQAAGVARIIYLGGLGNDHDQLSAHLRSRHDTGDMLRTSGVPVTELRAAIIVGAGSASFEMIRTLAERLPVLICPRWVFSRVQPIAITDVIRYLIASIETTESAGQIIEIGGADVLTYGDMMLGYAHARGLRRWILPVPVLTPRLSAYWVHWMTPISANLAHPLIEGLRNEIIVRDQRADGIFPTIHPLDYQTSLRSALALVQSGEIETAWSDALSTSLGDRAPVVLATHEGVIIERRERIVEATPSDVFAVVTSLGGQRGWLYANLAWQLRGLLDRLLGGVGLRRGRRHPRDLRVGDAVDFWRVESVEPLRRLRLRAEMKVPGRAWLEFSIEPTDTGARLCQTAYFAPRGLMGVLYWYILYPVHALIFSGMITRIAQSAERLARSTRRDAAPSVTAVGSARGGAKLRHRVRSSRPPPDEAGSQLPEVTDPVR